MSGATRLRGTDRNARTGLPCQQPVVLSQVFNLDVRSRNEPLRAQFVCRLHRRFRAQDSEEQAALVLFRADGTVDGECDRGRQLSVRGLQEGVVNELLFGVAVEVEWDEGCRVVVVAPTRVKRTVLDNLNIGDLDVFDNRLGTGSISVIPVVNT